MSTPRARAIQTHGNFCNYYYQAISLPFHMTRSLAIRRCHATRKNYSRNLREQNADLNFCPRVP
jgi:hypothetical protein